MTRLRRGAASWLRVAVTTALLAGSFGSASFVPTAQAALVNLSGIVMVKSAGTYALALKADGTVLAWGGNDGGQLGNGTTNPSSTPTQVTGLGSGSGVIAISAGTNFAMALKSDGTVLAWGINVIGFLGDGTLLRRLTPVQVHGVGDVGILSGVTAIAAGFSHASALKSDGTVVAWGSDNNGNLGKNTIGVPSTTPVQVHGVGDVGNLSGVTAIAAGANATMALKSDGTVVAWGNNGSGQIGDNTLTNRLTPVQVHGVGDVGNLSGVTAISAIGNGGAQFSLALKSDGTVLGWGSNSEGNLGDNTTIQRNTPVQVTGLGSGSGVIVISAAGSPGNKSSHALKSDGTVLAWGANGSGQLGDGTTIQRNTPVQTSGLGSGSGVTAVSGGDINCFVLKSDGTVLGWGDNSSGQLGNGTFFGQVTPVQTSGLGSGSGVTAISAGSSHSLALKSDGTVLAWGTNGSGQLGDGTTVGKTAPVQVTGLGSGSGVIAIAAGTNFSLALKSDGTVLAWGNNGNGVLGDGTTVQKTTPVQVTGLGVGSGVTAISAGANSSMVLKSDGTVLAWGNNGNGALGDGTTTQRLTPVQVSGLGVGSGVTAISAGSFFALALQSDGTVLAWGINAVNQLGDGTTIQRLTPVQVSGLGSGSGVVAITAGRSPGAVSFARKSDGTVLGWGTNASGQLGINNTAQQTIPVQVFASGSGVTAAGEGGFQSLVLKSDGTVQAMGRNGSGQLGDGTLVQRITPVQVTGLGSGSGVTAVSPGSNFSLALKSDGSVLAWGANGSGQLGDGTVYTANLTPSNVLIDVPTTSSCPSPTVLLAKPNGNETLRAGEQYFILWSNSGCNIFGFKFSLSTDGGLSYPTPITPDSTGQGYAAWTVPDGITTSTARVKIETLTYGNTVAASDTSDADLSLLASTAPSPQPAQPPANGPTASSSYSPAGETAAASSISADKGLSAPASGTPACSPGSLIKGTTHAVYYCGADGKRYVFPTLGTYLSWFPDFSLVTTLSVDVLASVPLGGVVTYKPGVRMIKIQTDPKTYAVAKGGVLRWVQTEEVAKALYGADWNTKIDDVSDALFATYTVGETITSAQ